MKILVINAGSSSLKYQLIDMLNEQVIAKGLVERIGIEGANLRHQPAGRPDVRLEQPMKDHIEAMRWVLKALSHPTHGVIESMDEINAVGHRVLHCGERYKSSVLIDAEAIQVIKDVVPLGPLHNPANLMGIKACLEVMPNTPMVAVFDTAFHQTMPDYAYLYGIPYEYYEKYSIRRYGFHGTSHKYVSERAIALLDKPAEELKIITCHLGNGCSITAVDGGKSVDTSMGLTPLEGVLMGTRSGDLDPAVLEFLMNSADLSITEMLNVLNKKSGLLGISGVSSDMRDVLDKADEGDERCRTAVDVFCYRIRKYIGAYAAAMGGVDAVVFTAGIGENNPRLRSKILSNLGFLGIEIDEEQNKQRKAENDITAPGARVRTFVIATNEELVIARDTLALTTG